MSYLNSKPPSVLNPTNLNERIKFPKGRTNLKETLKPSNKINSHETNMNFDVFLIVLDDFSYFLRKFNLRKTHSKTSPKRFQHG